MTTVVLFVFLFFFLGGGGGGASILMTDIEPCSQWQKVCFSQFQGVNSQLKDKHFFFLFCNILTALCHSKLYFCIPNFNI